MTISRGPKNSSRPGISAAQLRKRLPHRPDEVEVGVELLDAVVPGIGDVDVAVLVHRHSPGLVEFRRLVAAGTEDSQNLAVGVELLDSIVPAVGDVEVPGGIDR